MRYVALLTIVLLSTVTAAAHAEGGHESQQGIWLHDAVSHDFEGKQAGVRLTAASLNDKPYQELHVEAGELIGKLDGQRVHDTGVVGTQLVLESFPDRVLLITGVVQHYSTYTSCQRLREKPEMSKQVITPSKARGATPAAAGPAWEYNVAWSYKKPGAPREPLCRHGALAVPGTWNTEAGQLEDSSQVFTFACLPAPRASCDSPVIDGGVIAKCVDMGYAPWAAGSPALGQPTEIGVPPLRRDDASARYLHNMCAVAMRADYWGYGRPHTFDGTPIMLFDATDLPLAPCSGDKKHKCPAARLEMELSAARGGRFVMEGIWKLKEGRARALCLSKTRWQSIDSADRVVESSGPLRFCDDYTIPQLLEHQPLLVSYSSQVDKALHRFQRGSDSITTTHVDVTEQGLVPICPRGCDCTGYSHVALAGTVLAPDLAPEQLAGFKQYRIRPLYSYWNKCSSTTATPEIAGSIQKLDAALKRQEGYLFSEPPEVTPAATGHHAPAERELWLWHHSAGYVTGISPPQNVDKRSLGYLLRRKSTDTIPKELNEIVQRAASYRPRSPAPDRASVAPSPVLDVGAGASAPRGCGCAPHSTGGALQPALSMVAVGLLIRRRKRRHES